MIFYNILDSENEAIFSNNMKADGLQGWQGWYPDFKN